MVQQVTTSGKTSNKGWDFFRLREETTTKHPKEKIEEDLEEDHLN